jgi:hypothetical protein
MNEETDNPEETMTWKRISDPSLVEEKLLLRNIKHFGQAQGSMFVLPELQDQFDYEGVTKAVELLLQCEINIPESMQNTMGTRTLLQHLANKNNLPEMECEISKHAFISTLRK